MKLGIVISRSEPEAVWNAIRLGNFARKRGDDVSVFLLGAGVDAPEAGAEKFPVAEQFRALLDAGGRVMACTSCLKIRQKEGSDVCPLSTLQDLYDLIEASDKVISI
jgi:sulfur relay (sulfurtransferase) complex TusBCD TusD component (DsrE family)